MILHNSLGCSIIFLLLLYLKTQNNIIKLELRNRSVFKW